MEDAQLKCHFVPQVFLLRIIAQFSIQKKLLKVLKLYVIGSFIIHAVLDFIYSLIKRIFTLRDFILLALACVDLY